MRGSLSGALGIGGRAAGGGAPGWRGAALAAVFAALAAAAAPAQTINVIPTTHNGDPFRSADIQRKFVTGEPFSLNIVADTRAAGIEIDAIAVSVRFPSGRIKKTVRFNGSPPGSGWPLYGGVPVISQTFDLPAGLREHLGSSFLAISGSAENRECFCDTHNGVGMESLIHFLIVDLGRQKTLPPGLYHLFQTDWIVRQDCRIEEIEIEISDGERGRGLYGAFGEPLPNYILDGPTQKTWTIADGLEVLGTRNMEVVCRSDLHFIRGDTTADGRATITDAIDILSTLFIGGNPRCELAGDVNDNGEIDIVDPVFLLRSIFIGGLAVPPPHPDCGVAPVRNSYLCRVRCAGP